MTAQDFLCKAPKLGGAPERKRGRGGSLENHPACSDFFSGFALSGSRFAVLAGPPPHLGGGLRVINSFTPSIERRYSWETPQFSN